MATQRFIVKKIGDKYVPVPQEAAGICASWAAAGVALAALGVMKRGVVGTIAATLGAGMVYRGVTGRNLIDEWMHAFVGKPGNDEQGPSYQHDFKRRAEQTPEDVVDEAAMESFPASDPPARSTSTEAVAT